MKGKAITSNMHTIYNFRDFGGYRTQNGIRLKKGLLYRSGDLSQASEEDLARLSALGIKTICDLRSDRERQVAPDRIPNGSLITFFNIPMRPIVDYHARSLRRLFSLMFGKERRMDYIAESYKAYREYATGYLPQIKALLKHISNPNNLPLLVHCSAGKDRTGVVSGLIQHILGVSSETILHDYLKTNENLGAYIDEIVERLRKLAYFGIPWRMYMPLFDARADYLNAAYAQVRDEFGALDEWLRNGLKFSEEEQEKLVRVLSCR
jgi:protein-tyrosine phosphatase